MRFYDIVITKPDGGLYVPPSMKNLTNPSGGSRKASFSSRAGAAPNPSALDVTLNIPAYFLSAPRGFSIVRLFGVSLADIAAITHLVNHDIEVYAGMLDGYLPLSKNYKPELLTRGVIWQTSGAWEPRSTTLDLYIAVPTTRNPNLGDETAKVNITFDWKIGTTLESALKDLLSKTYGKSASNPKGADIKINISDQLVARTNMPGGPYKSFNDFCTQLKNFTQSGFTSIKRLDGAPYQGVTMHIRDNTIYADDGTKPGTGSTKYTRDSPLQIKFTDLIGQPTWKTAFSLNFKTIMRGDITLNDYVVLPKGLNSPYVLTQSGQQQAANTPQGLSLPSKHDLAFSGLFQVTEILHTGQFRQASGNSWVSSFDCLVPSAMKKTEPTLTPEDVQEVQKIFAPADPTRPQGPQTPFAQPPSPGPQAQQYGPPNLPPFNAVPPFNVPNLPK